MGTFGLNKYNKLVPYKESGVTKDDIEKECKRRGLGVGSTKTESIKILERSDQRDVSMFPEHLDLEDLAADMPALIDTEEHKFSDVGCWRVGCWRAAAAPLADRWPLPAVGCCERASRRQRLDQGQHGERRGK